MRERLVGFGHTVHFVTLLHCSATTFSRLKQLTGQNTIYQQLGYLMRGGAPDALDLMVAANFAHMAMSLVERGESGRLVCLQRGVYSDVPIATMSHGKKRVNVAELYDAANYRPRIRHVLGMPMFLT